MEKDKHRIDFDFISQLEGSTHVGYVPNPDTSQSGVTIASGFDIGQCSVDEIEMSFPAALSQKLTPYAELKKQEAVAKLKSIPLKLSDHEVDCINQFSHGRAVDRIIDEWAKSEANKAFVELPQACQTVIASVAFQYGNLSRRTPNFWRQVTHEKWEDAVANLRDFGDLYSSRRNSEANLLSNWLKESNKQS